MGVFLIPSDIEINDIIVGNDISLGGYINGTRVKSKIIQCRRQSA